LRPEEWAVIERSDIDRREGVLAVRRTLTDSGVVELAKTDRSRRQVPLSPRALVALDELPARLDTRRLFTAPAGGPLDLDNFRRRQWREAIKDSRVAEPARIYDLRSTYASNQLAARVEPFELARVMGTSVRMIERHYGTLLGGAAASIAQRQAAFEAEQERAAQERSEGDS
jgi:integrase